MQHKKCKFEDGQSSHSTIKFQGVLGYQSASAVLLCSFVLRLRSCVGKPVWNYN